MSVFTAYFCGTGSHRFDDSNPNFWNGELVSTLASNDQSREFAHWIAVDGPGSGNQQDDNLFVEPGSYFNWSGTLFGRGWEENVSHVLHVIKGKSDWQRTELSESEYAKLKAAGVPIPEATSTSSWFWRTYSYGQRQPTPQALQEQIIAQFRKPVIPTQVNLVGWSRGGISCHMLANAMAEDPQLKHVPVNIFAIDRYPGSATCNRIESNWLAMSKSMSGSSRVTSGPKASPASSPLLKAAHACAYTQCQGVMPRWWAMLRSMVPAVARYWSSRGSSCGILQKSA